jgi:hypothetical protein
MLLGDPQALAIRNLFSDAFPEARIMFWPPVRCRSHPRRPALIFQIFIWSTKRSGFSVTRLCRELEGRARSCLKVVLSFAGAGLLLQIFPQNNLAMVSNFMVSANFCCCPSLINSTITNY